LFSIGLRQSAPEADRNDYADQLRERIQTAYAEVNEGLGTVTQRMKKRYDARVKPLILKPGQLPVTIALDSRREEIENGAVSVRFITLNLVLSTYCIASA
jgi:hypothetical protein